MIDQETLKRWVKEAVSEALEGRGAPPRPSPEASAPGGLPTYEALFHRIMAQVARGELDARTAGRLLAEAYQAFGEEGQEGPGAGPKQEPAGDAPKQEAGWMGGKAESALEMMERMRQRLEREAEEARLFVAMKQLEMEEQQQRIASELEALKRQLSGKG
jgi:hypothetical protein